jgi:phospholipid N-methyltransferase
MSKQMIAKIVAGLIVTSTITIGAISPSSAMASQDNLKNNPEINPQYAVMQESFTNRRAAAQFTFDEDGKLVLTVTPKANFRSQNRNFQNGALETPVVDEDLSKVSLQKNFYTHLFDAYDKLLSLYDKLLNSFLPAIAK